MVMRQFLICVATSPRGAAPLPAVPAATAASCTLPQKSAVNTPALKLTPQKRTNTASAATFTTMMRAFRNEALSTPRMTSTTSTQLTSDPKRMEPMLLPGRKYGKKNPMVEARIVANATLPSHADSQYPQPDTKPANGPKPSCAYAYMLLSSGFFTTRLLSESASMRKPTPTTSHETSTPPGEATWASCPVSANTPVPMHELTTSPTKPKNPMPPSRCEAAAAESAMFFSTHWSFNEMPLTRRTGAPDARPPRGPAFATSAATGT